MEVHVLEKEVEGNDQHNDETKAPAKIDVMNLSHPLLSLCTQPIIKWLCRARALDFSQCMLTLLKPQLRATFSSSAFRQLHLIIIGNLSETIHIFLRWLWCWLCSSPFGIIHNSEKKKMLLFFNVDVHSSLPDEYILQHKYV